MSDCWFNIRVIWWHIQIKKGNLFRPRLTYNGYHWFLRGVLCPVQVFSCQPLVGWKERNSTQWDTYENGGIT